MQDVPNAGIGPGELLLDVIGVFSKIFKHHWFKFRNISFGAKVIRHGCLASTESHDGCDGWVGQGLADEFGSDVARCASNDELHDVIWMLHELKMAQKMDEYLVDIAELNQLGEKDATTLV